MSFCGNCALSRYYPGSPRLLPAAAGEVVEDLLQDVVPLLAVGEGLVVEADAVQDDVGGEGVEVVGDDVPPAAEKSPGLRRFDERPP